MQISRKTNENRQNIASFVDFNDSDKDELTYCSKCYRVNILSRLGNRILKYDETPQADYDQWLQCHKCGTLVSVNNVKHESELEEVIQPINPYENNRKFESMGKKNKRKVGITRYSDNKIGVRKDKDPEIQQLIDSGVDITVIQ